MSIDYNVILHDDEVIGLYHAFPCCKDILEELCGLGFPKVSVAIGEGEISHTTTLNVL